MVQAAIASRPQAPARNMAGVFVFSSNFYYEYGIVMATDFLQL
jgi:hypothetical protein